MPPQTRHFISLSDAEKNDLILRTSAQLKISPVLIEKDFWVSWLLNKIFSLQMSRDFTFKGGTSLSKSYDIVSRFSEDIDLTIDRKIFSAETDETSLSSKGFQRLIDSNDKSGSHFVNKIFKPELEKTIITSLNNRKWEIATDEDESKNLRFYYPTTQKQIDNSYIQQSVLIEFGVRGEITPSDNRLITSYVDQNFSDLLSFEKMPIQTLSPKRTFWEKITILHAENNRPHDKMIGDRLSRHYYDIYQLIHKGIANSALTDIRLLHDVIEHKKKYFRSAWAKYEDAVPASLKIYPNPHLIELLKRDYKQMEGMLFGDIPSFDLIMKSIKDFETRINRM